MLEELDIVQLLQLEKIVDRENREDEHREGRMELIRYIISSVKKETERHFMKKHRLEFPDGDPCEWHHKTYRYLTDRELSYKWLDIINDELTDDFSTIVRKARDNLSTFDKLQSYSWQGPKGPLGATGPGDSWVSRCAKCRR